MAKEFTPVNSGELSEQFLDAVTSPKFVKMLKLLIVLMGLALFTGCTGARTGLEVPAAPAVTFLRAGASTGGRWEIYQTAPYANPPGGRVRLGGVNVLSHDVHTSGEWLAYSTVQGLYVQDWRGYTTQRSTEQTISGIKWSPDARRIAFSQSYRIWVVDAGGSGSATALTPEYTDPASQQAAMSPAWTPDGSRLYFIRYREVLDSSGHPLAVDHQTWTVAADGSDLRLVRAGTPTPSQPGIAVSHDGAAVLYATGFDASPSIVRLDLASGATTTLIANAGQPAFGATGRYLAYVRNGQVWMCAYDGSTCVNEQPISNGTNDRTPSWVGG